MSQPPQPGPWGGPPSGPAQPPPGYYPQPGWGPPQPPKRGNGLKWLLGGVAVLLVVAIAVGVTVIVMLRGSNGTSTPSAASDVASANDTGPVGIITVEPTCQAWAPISNTLTQVQSNGWGDRDPSIPAADWTAKQRNQYEAVGKNLRQAADQAVSLARQTPNRVVRELYEQFVAFSRAYADSIATYSAADDYLALANIAASIALDSVCNSITYGSAGQQSGSVPTSNSPSNGLALTDPSNAKPFVTTRDNVCNEVIQRRERLIADTAAWAKLDPNIPGPQWTAEQKSVMDQTGGAMTEFANDIESFGNSSTNSTFHDLAFLTAIYVRAYVNSIPSYATADNYLITVATRTNNLLVNACKAAPA